jgi:hypothetical protein
LARLLSEIGASIGIHFCPVCKTVIPGQGYALYAFSKDFIGLIPAFAGLATAHPAEGIYLSTLMGEIINRLVIEPMAVAAFFLHENFQTNKATMIHSADDIRIASIQGFTCFPSAISVPAADGGFLAIFVGGDRLVAGNLLNYFPFKNTFKFATIRTVSLDIADLV